MSNETPARKAFDKVLTFLKEIDDLRERIAEERVLYVESDSASISPQGWADLVAVARKAAMDAMKRDKAETTRKRRDDLAGQLGLDL